MARSVARRIGPELDERLGAARSFAEAASIVVESLRAEVGVNGVNCFPLFEGAVLDRDAVCFHEEHPQLEMARMAEQFAPEADRLLLAAIDSRELQRPLDISEAILSERFARTRVLNEFFRPFHVERQAIRFFGGPCGLDGFVCMSRPATDRPFGADDLRTLDVAAARLAAHLAWLRQASPPVSPATILQALEQALPVACAIFGGSGELCWWSEAARARLGIRTTRYRGGSVHGVDATALGAWRRAALRALETDGGGARDGSLVAVRADRGPGSTWVLVTEREGAGPQLPHLTAREREVASLLAAGYSSLNVAALLALSEETVRTHTKRIYRKLGVANRVQLALAWSRLGLR